MYFENLYKILIAHCDISNDCSDHFWNQVAKEAHLDIFIELLIIHMFLIGLRFFKIHVKVITLFPFLQLVVAMAANAPRIVKKKNKWKQLERNKK